LKICSESIFVKNTNSLRPENPIGEPFYELSEVDSSNNYAMRQVQSQMAEHGSTWFVHYQNAGKGQRGKPWNAEPGQNLMMSVLLEPHFLSIDNQFLLNVAVALSCFNFFNEYAVDGTSVKWPNDLYWRDRKAGGVLVENIIQGKEWKYAVVGIGININQTLFPAALPNPVSLKQITGKSFDPVVLAKVLCKQMEYFWNLLQQGKEEVLLLEYNNILYKLHEKVSFEKESAIFEARVEGVNRKGDLVVNTGSETSLLPFGSVNWRLPNKK
jgi:BirA family biotin operon repressor/biotin-[acetyl-CoA-carboxylase] ligase